VQRSVQVLLKIFVSALSKHNSLQCDLHLSSAIRCSEKLISFEQNVFYNSGLERKKLRKTFVKRNNNNISFYTDYNNNYNFQDVSLLERQQKQKNNVAYLTRRYI